jgi:hypothetical protein
VHAPFHCSSCKHCSRWMRTVPPLDDLYRRYQRVKIHTLPLHQRTSRSHVPPLPALEGMRPALPLPAPAHRRRCALAAILELPVRKRRSSQHVRPTSWRCREEHSSAPPNRTPDNHRTTTAAAPTPHATYLCGGMAVRGVSGTCEYAARNGHMEVLRWAVGRGLQSSTCQLNLSRVGHTSACPPVQ